MIDSKNYPQSCCWYWVVWIARGQQRHLFVFVPDETTLPGEIPSTGYSSSDKEGSYMQAPIGITTYHYQGQLLLSTRMFTHWMCFLSHSLQSLEFILNPSDSRGKGVGGGDFSSRGQILVFIFFFWWCLLFLSFWDSPWCLLFDLWLQPCWHARRD